MQPGVRRAQGGVAGGAASSQRAGAGVDQHVGGAGDLAQPRRVAGCGDHAALVGVQPGEDARSPAAPPPTSTSGGDRAVRIAARRLDLDHVGAEVGEQLAAIGQRAPVPNSATRIPPRAVLSFSLVLIAVDCCGLSAKTASLRKTAKARTAMHEDLIGPLLRRELGVEAAAIRPLIGGEVGRVFRVDASGASFVVKFVNASPEPPFAAERIDDRVYGSRWSNLVPAYDLLRANGVAVPVLQASGTLADAGLHYAVLDYLDGDPDDGSPAWAACVGAVLGRLHTITRAHHGWVGMDPADAVRWPSAFATSFRGWLARGEGHLAANSARGRRAAV